MCVMMSKRTAAQKISQFVRLGVLGGGVCGGLLLQRHDDKASRALGSLLHSVMGAEAVHQATVLALSRGCYFRSRLENKPELRVKLWGREFRNPVGTAVGFDKHGEAVQGLSDLGFGFVEVGPVTPQPQEDKLKLRQNFNSEGHATVRKRLELLRAGGFSGVLGVSLDKNETSDSKEADYCEGVRQFAHTADYFVINISSPVKSKNDLKSLIQVVLKARQDLQLGHPPALVIKIAPNLSEADMKDIVDVITARGSQVDGLIISSTSLAIGAMHRMTGGQVPIIGAGGVTSGEEVMQRMRAGASLVQVDTGIMARGPACATNIRRELGELLTKEAVGSITEWVGAENR